MIDFLFLSLEDEGFVILYEFNYDEFAEEIIDHKGLLSLVSFLS